MPARTFTSAGVNNLWSNPANWDGGLTIPAEDDSVTIPAGQTCEYDYNSAYTTGINGLTITGTLKLTRTAGTYKLFMKAATTINGAGTFDCGASALDPIPFTAKHLVTGGAGWYVNGASGLTMTVYAAEPTIKMVTATGAEAAGQTVIEVDTDVTGDIWTDGDEISISDLYAPLGNDTEYKTIAAGGIAAGSITITTGLALAKTTTPIVVLLTRNVRFVSGYFKSFASGKLTFGGGEVFRNEGKTILDTCTNVIISGGSFHRSTNFTALTGSNISGGVIVGNYLVGASVVSGGIFVGNTNGFTSTVNISGGIFAGNSYVLNYTYGSIVSGGAFYNNNRLFTNSANLILIGGTFTNNYFAMSNITGIIRNVTVPNLSGIFNANNVIFSGSPEVSGYTLFPELQYSDSVDHNGVSGAYRAWTTGGITTKQAVTVPTGYASSMQTVLESATKKGYWQKEITISAGASVNIIMNLRKDASMAYLPRVIVFNKAAADPFAGGAGLYTFTMTNSIDTWEDDLYTYTNSGTEDVTLVIRCQGMNATGNLFSALEVEQINVDLTGAIAKIDVIDGLVDAIKAKTDQLAFTVANQVDANALTGGGGATADEVADAVWDEAHADHTGAGSFGAKNQKVVPSETINDYKADISGLSTTEHLSEVETKIDMITSNTEPFEPMELPDD